MYRFFGRGARISFFILTSLATACSSPLRSSTTSVGLPAHALEDGGDCLTNGKIRESPAVYRCTTDHGPVYVTTLRDCSIPEKFSYQATTRQLFVGVNDLHVIKQLPVEFGEVRTLHSLVSGLIDLDPVTLSTFTIRDGVCITDLAIWRVERNIPEASDTEAFDALTYRLAEQLVGGALLGGKIVHVAG